MADSRHGARDSGSPRRPSCSSKWAAFLGYNSAFDPHAAAERLNAYRVNALREFTAGTDGTVDGEIILSAYLQSYRRAAHECASDWVRGQDAAKRHDYDFTDPADAEKVRPEIRALFKGFGLSRHEPSYDAKDPSRGMSEEDLQFWMKAAIFNGIDCPVADFDVYLQRYGSAKAYWRMYRSPRFEMRPSLSLPPLEWLLGVRPSQAANSRPERNTDGSGTVLAIAMAVIGPTPGIEARRRLS